MKLIKIILSIIVTIMLIGVLITICNSVLGEGVVSGLIGKVWEAFGQMWDAFVAGIRSVTG